jgi:hypothetical protein
MKLIDTLLNKLFDRDNIKTALAALPVALVELTQYNAARITKEGLIRALAIKQHRLTDKQFNYLLRDLPYQMHRLGYLVVIKNDEIWLNKQPIKHKRFLII